MKLTKALVIAPIFASGIAILTSGCVSVTSKTTVQPLVDLVNKANNNPATQAAAPAFQMTPNVMLAPQISANVQRVVKQLDDMGMSKLPAVQKLVAATTNNQPVKLSNGEVKDLAKTFLDTFNKTAFNGSTDVSRNAVLRSHVQFLAGSPTPSVAAVQAEASVGLMNMFEGYYLAYANGKFTLRDGTVLGKPTVSLTLTNGNLSGTIPNSTVDGIVTVFTEALCDSIMQTPIFYGMTTTQTYTNGYVNITNIYPAAVDTNDLIQIFRLTTTTKRDYFLNGSAPTAAAFLPCFQVVGSSDETKKPGSGLTQKEVQFIRAVSGLTAKQSQALGTLIFQTWGGGSVGQFAYLHVSIGNNQVLTSIVQNLLSSVSYHTAERPLTSVFWNYNGKDGTVNALLDHYQDLITAVETVSKQ